MRIRRFGLGATAPLACVLSTMAVSPLAAEEADPPADPAAKIALTEVAPELIFSFRRYAKFYGDPNTKGGDLRERSQLTGDWGGLRDRLIDNGIFLDIGVSQFLQGNASGGNEASGAPRINGSADYWLTLDSGRAGLWSGGLLMMHGESAWGPSVNADVGSLLPANFDATMPAPDGTGSALSELYAVQALPADLAAIIGKLDFAGLADQSAFANNERTQFGYTGLVNNPILGAFVPYTALGGALAWTPSKEHAIAALFAQTDGSATRVGFDTLFKGNNTFGGQYQYSPTINDLPGNYRVILGYTTKNVTSFAIDERHLIEEIIGEVPVAEKPNNYALLVNFDQYLWVDEAASADRKHLPPVGVGLFGRAGWAPEGRNVIDQFYSFGVGGYGLLLPDRHNDQWGLGWAGSHISGDLRDALGTFNTLESWEHGIEAFYNAEVTPAAHLTLNAQVIQPPVEDRNAAFTLGARLQLDF